MNNVSDFILACQHFVPWCVIIQSCPIVPLHKQLYTSYFFWDIFILQYTCIYKHLFQFLDIFYYLLSHIFSKRLKSLLKKSNYVPHVQFNLV